MKLISFCSDGRDSWGKVDGDEIVDLGKKLPRYPTLAEFLGSEDFDKRDAVVAGLAPDLKLSAVKLLPVIPRPEKIVCVVRNYMDHHKEAIAHGMKREITNFPPIFLRVWRSLVADGDPIVRPHVSSNLDWEGELAVVIGRGGRYITQEDAWSHVAGYSIFNDASIRDYQQHAQQIAAGKNFVGTGPFGPWLITKDEVPDPENLALKTILNGEVMQSSNTSFFIFRIPRLIEYASSVFDLVPGDVIATGTPAGVGFTRKPPVFMKPGDVVEIEIEKIGTLRNPIEDEKAARTERNVVDIDVRKTKVATESIWRDGGPRVAEPLVVGSALVVVRNPYAGRYELNLLEFQQDLRVLGRNLAKDLIRAMGGADYIQAYGKGMIVGEDGELEHAAVWHEAGGWATREALGEPKAIVPAAKTVGPMGTRLMVPLGHIHAAYVRGHFGTAELTIWDGPKRDEIVYGLVMANGGRVHARIGGLRAEDISANDGLR